MEREKIKLWELELDCNVLAKGKLCYLPPSPSKQHENVSRKWWKAGVMGFILHVIDVKLKKNNQKQK